MRALIIGGGIAGLLTGMALRRVGIEATVFEAYAADAPGAGAWLTLAVNGLDALRTLELQRQVLAVGFATPHIDMRSGTGKRLGVLPIGGTLADGTVTHSVKRAALHQVLQRAALERGVQLQYGKRLARAACDDAGISVWFEDGSAARGELLIGADGLHSRVRTLIDPQAPAPRYSGLGNVGGFVSGVALDAQPGEFHMSFGHQCFFGYALHPSGEVWWFANPYSKHEASRDELRSIDDHAWRALLIEQLSLDASPAAALVRETPRILVGGNQYSLPRVPHWYRERMIIVGDAAHAASPASGQGASMAAEDALELSRCLRDAPDHTQAFAAFERLRRKRVEKVVADGNRRSAGKAPGVVGRTMRDLILPVAFKHLSKQVDNAPWIHRHHIVWEEPVALR